jgi:hypothetical protein
MFKAGFKLLGTGLLFCNTELATTVKGDSSNMSELPFLALNIFDKDFAASPPIAEAASSIGGLKPKSVSFLMKALAISAFLGVVLKVEGGLCLEAAVGAAVSIAEMVGVA